MALADILNSLSLQPAGVTNVQAGVPVSVGVVPDISQVTLTDVKLVDVDLDFIGKGVEFLNADPSDPTTTGVLPPYDLTQIPPTAGAGVQGLIGKIKGKFPVALPTDVLPRMEVTWRVEDTTGVDLIASGDAVPLTGLNSPLLTVLFLPEFVELTLPPTPVGTSTRRVSADVRLVAGATSAGPQTLGPVDILVPQLPLPLVLAMFRDSLYRGATLIMVPGNSAVPDLATLTQKVQDLQTALNPIRTVVRLAALISGLDALTTLLNNEPHIKFRKTDSIGNLNDITLIQNSWYQNDIEAEDELSSLFMIGPPNRAAEFFNDRSFKDGEGKFTLTLGPLWFAGIRHLHKAKPLSEPTGSEIDVNKEPPGGFLDPDDFGDDLSSVRFLRSVS